MKRVIKLKLPISKEIILPTLKAYTKAFNYVCLYGYENNQYNNIKLHHATYKNIREYLPSQLTISSRTKAYEALKSIKDLLKKNKAKVPQSKLCSIRYDKNSYNIDFKKKTISLSTIGGRIKITLPYVPPHFLKYLDWRRTSADLLIKGKHVFLNVVYEKQAEQKIESPIVVGLDRGINNIAVLSNNTFYSGSLIKTKTKKIKKLRSALQSKNTKSAKRHLKKLSKKENCFRRNMNHVISKNIINQLPNGSTLVLEDLSGISRKKKKLLGKRFNNLLNSWAYFQLEQFLIYKAEEKNIKIVKVSPSYTSQKCSKCGHTEKQNRNGSNFKCCSCGFQLNADLNASRNIKQNWLIEQCSLSTAQLSSSLTWKKD
jgi:IS605 OrfB family transposase